MAANIERTTTSCLSGSGRRVLEVLADALDLDAAYLLTPGANEPELVAGGGPTASDDPAQVEATILRLARTTLESGEPCEEPGRGGHLDIALPVCGPDGAVRACLCAADARGRTATGKGRDLLELGRESLEKDLLALGDEGTSREASLRGERDLLAHVLDSMVDGAYVADPDGVVVFANGALEAMLGPPANRSCHDFLGCGDGPCPWCDRTRIVRGEALRGEWVHPELGRSFEIMNSALPLGDGRIGILGILRDVSEVREGERQRMRDAERLLLTRKLESLRVLAGGIAHDYNNLLQIILGNADLAREALETDSPAMPRIGEIVASTRRAVRLTRQMLDYSGRGRHSIERIDVAALLASSRNELEPLVPRGVSLRIEVPEDSLPVRGDPGQLRQVLASLVANSAEALGDVPGTIAVTGGRAECDGKELESTIPACRLGRSSPLAAGPYVFLQVEDTGAGMDAETRDRAFEPFFTTRFVGRGLGLPAVLGIVLGHGGALMLDSEVDRGTTVRVLLPEFRTPDPAPETG